MSRREYHEPRSAHWWTPRRIVYAAVAAVVLIFGLLIFGSSFYTIDAGERGVILTQGRVTGVADPGFGIKMPFVTSVVPISTRTRTWQNSSIEAYSADQQAATIRVSLTWAVDPTQVVALYEQYGTIENAEASLVARRVEDALKPVFGRFSAATAIQERARLNSEISAAVMAAIDGGVIVPISVQIEDIAFSMAYEAAMDARAQAEAAVLTERQTAERNRVQAEGQAAVNVAQARGNADARLAQATAEAEAVRLAAQAEAEAIQLRGDAEAGAARALAEALVVNPTIVQMEIARRWNGALPTQMVPGGALPFIDVTGIQPVPAAAAPMSPARLIPPAP